MQNKYITKLNRDIASFKAEQKIGLGDDGHIEACKRAVVDIEKAIKSVDKLSKRIYDDYVAKGKPSAKTKLLLKKLSELK